MITVFTDIALLLLVYATVWYVVALVLKRNDVADIAWGLGFCVVCLYLFFTQPHTPVALVLYGMVLAWGLRLSIHIFIRNKYTGEDFRYRQWRESWGKTFYWRSYLQVFLLQAFILFVIVSPVVWVATAAHYQWTVLTYAGLLLWLLGWVYQSVADYQLRQFVRYRKVQGAIMQEGLWKYSRHPNYFGEILMWWAIFLMATPVTGGWWFIISPLTITFLLSKVSGVPMLEKKYDNNPQFQAYKKSTPALFPKFW